MPVTLVLGGTRSGKSRHAEALAGEVEDVTYVATGPAVTAADDEWAARVGHHRNRRPSGWAVLETRDVAGVLAGGHGTVVVDCLGTWLTGLVDDAGLWDDLAAATELVGAASDVLHDALNASPARVIVVSNEVGMAPVATTPAGRWFQDELGRLNARVSALAAHVHLLVAGRVVDLSDAPIVT